MKELSDEQFDAGLKRKMEHLSLDPGKDLWTAIGRELDAGEKKGLDAAGEEDPAAGRGKEPGAGWEKDPAAGKKEGSGKVVLFRRICVAAAVCLLAAAGVWMYQRAPLRENSLLAAGRSPIDTVSEESGSKVIILNRSRRRPAAAEETPVPERKPAPGEIPVREGEPEGIPAESPAGKAGPPVESPAGSPVKGSAAPGPNRSVELPSSERRIAAAGGEKKGLPGAVPARAGNASAGAEVFPTGAEHALAGSGNVLAGTGDVRSGAGNRAESPLTSVESRLNDPGDSYEETEIFSGGPEIASVPTVSGDRGKPSAAGLAESALDREVAASSPDISPGPGETTDPKRSLLPPEVRQVDNVGEALNLIAATIDKSEDKFLHLTRDERSARWKGVRLDLGLVTISYNKPDSRKMRNNE